MDTLRTLGWALSAKFPRHSPRGEPPVPQPLLPRVPKGKWQEEAFSPSEEATQRCLTTDGLSQETVASLLKKFFRITLKR